MTSEYTSEILTVSAQFKLNPDMVAAQVTVESAGNPWAWNPEPAYRYLWNVRLHKPFRPLTANEMINELPPADFPTLAGDRDQEWWAQQASWGLMQVVGAVARQYGFRNNYLSELCEPIQGLTVGCHVMSDLLEWSNGDISQALAAYNGGRYGNAARPFRNQAYADKVLAAHAQLTAA
jgi:hypothetical protein